MRAPDNLQTCINFVLEADRLKNVNRQTYVTDGSRHENSAEHSWHLCLMAMLLVEYVPDGVSLPHVLEMLTVHDLVEIDAGDTFCYDEEAARDKAEREALAAARLFSLLPDEQAERFRALWSEFEARETPEARFANALDRLQPMLLNYRREGGAWREHGVTAEHVLRRNRVIADASPALWQFAKEMVMDSVSRGYLEPGSGYAEELARG